MKSTAVLIMVTLVLSACTSPSAKISQFDFGATHAVATTGNLRLVTERQRLLADGTSVPVVCTEPSPDYAVAFGRTIDAKVTAPGAAGETSGDAKLTLTQTEAITALVGRTAGVLALRDGLYAACQSYVNGVIGHDAYAVILSQYGSLLVALVGSEKQAVPAGNEKQAAKNDGYGQSAKAALLVACVSTHDPTRLPSAGTRAGSNTLLTRDFCRAFLGRSVR